MGSATITLLNQPWPKKAFSNRRLWSKKAKTATRSSIITPNMPGPISVRTDTTFELQVQMLIMKHYWCCVKRSPGRVGWYHGRRQELARWQLDARCDAQARLSHDKRKETFV